MQYKAASIRRQLQLLNNCSYSSDTTVSSTCLGNKHIATKPEPLFIAKKLICRHFICWTSDATPTKVISTPTLITKSK